MFSRNKKNKTSGTLVRMVPSIISIDLTIKGDLESAGEIQVDGQVDGDIRSKVLLVGKKATVNGEIYAETVRVHGNVNGQIKAKFVNLAKSARVVGDIHHENLSIQEGAFLEGRMVHMNEQEVQKTVPASAQAPQDQAPQTQAPQTQAPQASTSQQKSQAPANVAQPSSNGKPAEDRVNLVVKTGQKPGTKSSQPQNNAHQASNKANAGKTA